jgi:cobalt-zinc-cadmium efflux system outer membrane protein
MRKMRTFSYVATLLCALWLSPAGADEPLGSNLVGLLDYAREHNPELAASRYEAEAAQQRSEPAGALPDPVLRTELMDITNQGTTASNRPMPWIFTSTPARN